MTADSARAALIDLANAWRRIGLQMETEHFDTARAVVYAECASQIERLTIKHLTRDDSARICPGEMPYARETLIEPAPKGRDHDQP
jgi:hypothetical protein